MDVTITAIEGNRQKLDGGAMFGNAPRALWERWLPPDGQNRIELACRSLLIEAGPFKILCETGIGAFFEPKLAERYGVQEASRHLLLASLTACGLSEQAITHVVLSHLHFDHAGGLLPAYGSGNDRLLFPNASYLVGETAFERAVRPHPRDKASFIPGLTEKLVASGRLKLIQGREPPSELRGLVSFRYSEGHTPGQMHTLVTGADQAAFFCGDLVPGQAWLHIPVTMGYDRFPEALIDEKTGLYAEALADDWLLFFTHDPEICMVQCRKDDGGRVVPRERFATCVRYAL